MGREFLFHWRTPSKRDVIMWAIIGAVGGAVLVILDYYGILESWIR